MRTHYHPIILPKLPTQNLKDMLRTASQPVDNLPDLEVPANAISNKNELLILTNINIYFFLLLFKILEFIVRIKFFVFLNLIN